MPEAVSGSLPSRRGFLGACGVAIAAAATGCESASDLVGQVQRHPREVGRLTFVPSGRQGRGGRGGEQALQGASDAPPARLYAPPGPADDLTLVVCLHGAGSPAGRALARLRPFADEHRLLLLAPKSAEASWDVAFGGFGPDVVNIDALLREVDARYAIRRYALNGFSDGASYALSLGVANGHLFDSVIAWSPGFRAPTKSSGRPKFFISHGTADTILPIHSTSRRLVPDLRERGYDVTYAEFDGEHVVPSDIRTRSVGWLGSSA